MNVFFSIIIPVFNAADTISVAIESIINQQFKDFELLIMDGGSTDKTIDIINNYNDSRLTIVSEKDKGIYDAMNKGILRSSGKFLYFIGSDDSLHDENVLQLIYEQLQISQTDIVYGNVILKSNKEKYAGEFDLERLLYKQNICHQSIFYSKECFNKLGKYNLKYITLADWDMNIRCFMHPDLKITYADINVAIYNDVEGMSSSEKIRDEEFLRILPMIAQRKLTTELSSIKYSKEYGIGKLIYRPFKFVRKMFS